MTIFTYMLESDNIAALPEPTSVLTGKVGSDATVTFAMRDEDDNPVAGAIWPITLPWDASVSEYRAGIPRDLVLSHGDRGTAIYVCVTASGVKRTWVYPMEATNQEPRQSIFD